MTAVLHGLPRYARSDAIHVPGLPGLPRYARSDGVVIANAVTQSMTADCMDRHGLRPRDDGVGSRSVCGIGPIRLARSDEVVIANEVKQSMTPDCLDCRATLAVTRLSLRSQ